jgi:hypothetical protein
MKKRFFALSVNGEDMGIFEAEGPYDALDAQAREAGYASKEDADQRVISDGGTPAEMDIEEITADEARRIEDLISKGYTQCQALDEVREGGDMPTLREQLEEKIESMGFWEAVQHFVNAGWDYSDFNAAGYREMCESFDNNFEENMDYLESLLIKKAVEDAGMEYGTFDSGFMAHEWNGKWYKYGGWSKGGNDWIVCGNSLKEIQGQISQLANG